MGRQTTVGLLKTSIFSPFGRHVFEILRNKANIVIQYYLAPRRLSIDPENVTLNDLELLFYTLNSILRRHVYSYEASIAPSEAWLSEVGYS